MPPVAGDQAQQAVTPDQKVVPLPAKQPTQDEEAHDEEQDDEEYHDTSSEHQPVDPTKHPITPGVNKRRQAAKLHMIQSPTDNIFSPISKKLLGRKRTDVVKELPEF